MRRLFPLLVLLCGCAPRQEILSVPPSASAPKAKVAAPAGGSGFLQGIAQRLTAPPGKSIDVLEGDAAARPDDFAALKRLGLGYYNAGGYLPAGTTLDRALKIRPGDAESRLYLGLSQLAQGDTDSATENLKKVSETPDAPKPLAARARVGLGDLAFDRKNDEKAAAIYALALKLDPNAGVAALALGALKAQAGKKPEAKSLFESAAKSLPPGDLRERALASLQRLAKEK